MVRYFYGCEDRLSGHRHCTHGHVQDCPDPGECELLPADVTVAPAEELSYGAVEAVTRSKCEIARIVPDWTGRL